MKHALKPQYFPSNVVPIRKNSATNYHRKKHRNTKVGDAAIRKIRKILGKSGRGVGR